MTHPTDTWIELQDQYQKLRNYTLIDAEHNGRLNFKLKCGICGNVWWVDVPNLKHSGSGCKECDKKARFKPREYHVQKILERNPRVLETIELGEPLRDGGKSKIHARCKICDHEWTPRTGSLKGGKGCPQCNRVYKTREEHLADIHNDNIKLGKLIRERHARIEAECLMCGHQWKPNIGSLKKGHGCPICSQDGPSSGHKLVVEALEYLGFIRNETFFEEISFSSCRYIAPLPFDIYIPKYECLIEYQGAQHYIFKKHYHGDLDGFEKQKVKDAIKKQWAEENGYLLLCIPYTVDRLDLIIEGLIERLNL